MAAFSLALPGCTPDNPAERWALSTDVQGVMASVLDPAADVYWDAVGWIVDEGGTTQIRPETLEDWEAVRNAAVVMAESANLLMLDGRALDQGPWIQLSRDFAMISQRAIRAAEQRDEQAVFDAGAEVYEACTACHASYALETLRPNVRSD